MKLSFCDLYKFVEQQAPAQQPQAGAQPQQAQAGQQPQAGAQPQQAQAGQQPAQQQQGQQQQGQQQQDPAIAQLMPAINKLNPQQKAALLKILQPQQGGMAAQAGAKVGQMLAGTQQR